jgi:Ca-activated chloride channel family protein
MSGFSFLAPWRLVLLIVPAALLAAYVIVQRRRTRYAMRFTNVALLDSVAPDKPGWRRHLAAAGLVAGLVFASMAAARPALASEQADKGAVVMVAIDTSLSMQATDVSPSRLEAAQAAARQFLTTMPKDTRVGLIAFDGQVTVLSQPTTDHAAVAQQLDNLRLGEGTAIGSAVEASVQAVKAATANNASNANDSTTTTTTPANATPNATIVVLSDGETTVGVPNDTAAQDAAQAGIPVNTIAFGTDSGTVSVGGGQQVQVPVNAGALARIAQQTNGQAFTAQSAGELQSVFNKLGHSVHHHPVTKQVSDWFAGGALGLLALAGVGSLLWFSRLP